MIKNQNMNQNYNNLKKILNFMQMIVMKKNSYNYLNKNKLEIRKYFNNN